MKSCVYTYSNIDEQKITQSQKELKVLKTVGHLLTFYLSFENSLTIQEI